MKHNKGIICRGRKIYRFNGYRIEHTEAHGYWPIHEDGRPLTADEATDEAITACEQLWDLSTEEREQYREQHANRITVTCPRCAVPVTVDAVPGASYAHCGCGASVVVTLSVKEGV